MTAPDTPRLYDDLAWLWPLWGDLHGEYAAHAEFLIERMRSATRREIRSVLVLGCGEGKTVFHLKRDYEVTGVDLSPAMLDQARVLNPECKFIEADMRAFERPDGFDAIFLDDGVAYITSREDLATVFRRAFRTLRRGGVLVTGPDETRETFVQNRTLINEADQERKPKNLDATFIENYYDPDPLDDTYEALFVYLIRENGRLRVEQDLHRLGIFPHAVWTDLLRKTGFEVAETEYRENDGLQDRRSRESPAKPGTQGPAQPWRAGSDGVFAEFICVKPERRERKIQKERSRP